MTFVGYPYVSGITGPVNAQSLPPLKVPGLSYALGFREQSLQGVQSRLPGRPGGSGRLPREREV